MLAQTWKRSSGVYRSASSAPSMMRSFPSVPGTRLSPAKVASVAEGALAREVARAEGLAVLRPVLAAAAGERELPVLAFLGAVLQDAHGAHVRLAHDRVEPLLALALLERPGGGREGERQDERDRGGLHPFSGLGPGLEIAGWEQRRHQRQARAS